MPKFLRKEEFEKVIKALWDRAKNKFIEDITFDTAIDNTTSKPKNTLKKTKNGQPTDVVNHIVTEWRDLEHVEKFTTTNLVDFSKRQNGVKFDSTGQNVINGTDNGLVKFNVVAGEEYTLIRQRANHGRIRFDSADGVFVGFLDEPMRIHNRWNRLKFTAPHGSAVATLELLVRQDNEKEVMVLQGNQLNLAIDTAKPIPYSDNALIQVGFEVSHKFNNSNSSLLSTTIESAIKEVNNKIAIASSEAVKSVNTIQPNQDGNVTIVAGNIGYDNTQTQIQANNVQGAIDKLKEDMGLLETSDIHIVQDKNGLDDLLNNQNKVKHGDLIYIINSDGVEDYTDTVVGTLNQPIAMIYDNDVAGNKLRVFSKFSSSINISADIVSYEDNTTNLGANNVQEAIEKLKEKVDDSVTNVVYDANKTLTVTKNGQPTQYDLTPLIGITSINREVGVDGAIELTTNNTVNSTEFKVGNTTYATLEYMTDQQADAIINNWN